MFVGVGREERVRESAHVWWGVGAGVGVRDTSVRASQWECLGEWRPGDAVREWPRRGAAGASGAGARGPPGWFLFAKASVAAFWMEASPRGRAGRGG